MNKKKSIVIACVLALILLIGGVIAYFTDTDTKTNEFTLKADDVNIKITETWTPADGLNLHPGATVSKAPSIENESSEGPVYVFAEVVIPCYATTGTTADAELFTFTSNTGWTLINTPTIDVASKTKTYIYAYGAASGMTTLAASSTTSTAVFSNVTVAPTLTKTQKDTASTTDIVVNAYGIQTDNLGVTAPADIYNLIKPGAIV